MPVQHEMRAAPAWEVFWRGGWVMQRSFQLIIDKMIDKGPSRIMQIRLLAVMRYERAL